jgi:hypothetical protein
MNRSVDSFASATSTYNTSRRSFYLSGGCRCRPEGQGYNYSTPFLSNKGVTYLSLSNAQKMVKKFLDEKRMSKEELAGVLEITVKSLMRLFSNNLPPSLLPRVSLPLARLYCGTKW